MMKKTKFSDRGAALVTVIMVMLLVMTFSGIALTYIVSQTKTERSYENDISALHAAEAGLNMYLWDLNKDSATSSVVLDTPVNYPDYNAVAAYQLHCSQNDSEKKVVEATGWMLNDTSIKRTIKAVFTKRSFTQYVYFSDEDPADIFWSSSDNCYGPYHTNTSLYVWGTPTFWSNVSYVGSIQYRDGPSTDHPNFHVTPQKVAPIDYPLNNNGLMAFAEADGYKYNGLTRIRLNSSGTVTILNLNHTPNLETRNLPPNGVIYVNGSVQDAANKFNSGAGNVFVSGVLDGRLTIAASNDIYVTGYDPTLNYYNSGTITHGIQYLDTDFNLNTTTGVITVTGLGQNDMLGLVANRYVAVLTRGWFGSGNSDADSAVRDFKIYGAAFAINGSFINSYQIDHSGSSYPEDPGTLTVRGAIIQNKRGGVGVGSGGVVADGYAKNYAHDPRMMYESPPNFLRPVDSGWEISDWTEY